MTETLARPSASSMPPRRTAALTRPSAARVGVGAAVRSALVGLLVIGVPALLVWATDSRAGSGVVDALRSVGQLWLVASGASLDVPDGHVALAPLGLCALPMVLLWRAGARASSDVHATSVRDAARVAAAIAVAYAVVAAVVAVASTTLAVRPSVLSAFASALVMGVLGAGAGALRPDRLWRAAWVRLPSRARRLLPAVGAASALLAAGGALLAGASLGWHATQAADLATTTAPGAVGGVALLLLGAAFVPNAVVWGASWLAGPGFAVGVGTSVGPFGHDLGAVPAFPLLAALPGSGVPSWVGVLALLVPVAAGALAGRLVARAQTDATAGRTAVEALLVGAGCGALWTALAWMSGGALGGDRLADVGPSAWRVGGAVALEVGLAAAAAALLVHRRGAPAAPAED